MNGGAYFSEAGVFLIQTIFGIYILFVALRFIFQWVHADFYNPVSQFLVTVTNPPLRQLRRFIPGYAGIDFPSIVLMIFLQAMELVLTILIATGRIPTPLGLFVLSIAELLKFGIYIFFFAIFI